MKEVVFINVQPDDNYFVWMVEAQIENFLALGYEYEYHCILFKPTGRRQWNPNFDKLEDKYKDKPNIKFFRYDGTKEIEKMADSIVYVPLIRPYSLDIHFTKYPELADKTIFYLDSDVIFTKKIDIEKYAQDDICYLSNTSSYLNLEYLEGKVNDAIPEKKALLEASNPIEKIAHSVGISKEIIKENNDGTGGAQYILKGIDAQFWKDVMNDCVKIRSYFRALNALYFENDDKGYQSWCADMWAVLWNLWKRGKKTKTPSELDFSWGTDPRELADERYIYHNAHVSDVWMTLNGEKEVMFFKGRYHLGRMSPHREKDYLQAVSKKYASSVYAEHLLTIKNPVF